MGTSIFNSIGTDRQANPAIMPFVIPKVVFFFPPVARPYIQNLFPRQSGMPCGALQRFCRARFYASHATATEAFHRWRTTRKFDVGENRAQSNPGAKGARDQLTVASHPTQAGSCRSRFVGKVSIHIYRICTIRSRQRPRSKPSASDFIRQRRG